MFELYKAKLKELFARLKEKKSKMLIARVVFYAFFAFAITVVGGYYYFTMDLPELRSIEDYKPNRITKVYSADNRVIAEFFLEKREVVALSKMPKHLIEAFLAAEDTHFYEHDGINYMSIMRAVYKNIMAMKTVQGASTITQQVAKTFFLTPERKIGRKIREAIITYRIEKNFTKDEILHLYLNQIYFGNSAYGVQSAAETYFGKNVDKLDVAESAMLAGLPKAPSKYSPFVNYEQAKKRQEYIIGRMVEEKFITPDDGVKYKAEKLKLAEKAEDAIGVAPYYTEYVRRYIVEKFGEETLYKGGLKIHTPLDVEMQRAANDAIDEGLREFDKRHGYRGPVAVLKTPQEIKAFKDENAKKTAAMKLEPGKYLKGIITAVNPKDASLTIDLGAKTGLIAPADLEWAKLYNPTKDNDAGKPQDLKKTFTPGDVVSVMIKSMPEKPGKDNVEKPFKLTLEQEPQAQASIFAMEPETGHVKAMVGGSDFNKSQFIRPIQSFRQPGSAFKPIIYTAAMDKNFTPASVVIDSPIVFGEAKDEPSSIKDSKKKADEDEKPEQWRPHNYDDIYTGPTTVREALARSRNIVTVKILQEIGVDHAINYARLMGINSALSRDLSLALGSSVVTLQELVTAFSTLGAQGNRPTPMYITKIADYSGNTLEDNMPIVTPVISPQTAYVMTNLLQGVVENGTGARAKALGRPVAAKTGTTNDLNDAWFVGYVPGLATGSWIGYDEERRLGRHETGAIAALPMWLKFMKTAMEGRPVATFKVPDGVEFVKIDAKTGAKAIASSQETIFEAFKAGTGPGSVARVAAHDKKSSDMFVDDSEQKEADSKQQAAAADATAAQKSEVKDAKGAAVATDSGAQKKPDTAVQKPQDRAASKASEAAPIPAKR